MGQALSRRGFGVCWVKGCGSQVRSRHGGEILSLSVTGAVSPTSVCGFTHHSHSCVCLRFHTAAKRRHLLELR